MHLTLSRSTCEDLMHFDRKIHLFVGSGRKDKLHYLSIIQYMVVYTNY